MREEEMDEKEFEEYWRSVSYGRQMMNTEFGNIKEWSRNAWLTSRRLLREKETSQYTNRPQGGLTIRYY